MSKIKKMSKIIDFKMNKLISSDKYKDELLLDKDFRFTPVFFELTAEVFFELIERAKDNNGRENK